MFIAVYRWRLKEGLENRFQQGWRRRTIDLISRRGSLGSRLHRSEDGTWLAYAQWPDKQTWEAARNAGASDEEAVMMMRESIEETYTDIYMELIDDQFSPINS